MRSPPRIPASFRLTALVLSVGVAACASGVSYDPGTVEGEPSETPFAETFSVVERDGYRIVDTDAIRFSPANGRFEIRT